MRYLTADAIYSPDRGFLPHSVLVLRTDGTVEALLPQEENRVPEGALEYTAGVLCPGFVNAHCHLELSHLRGHLAQHTGFVGFAQELIAKRATFSPEAIHAAIAAAADELWRNGVVAVGDIANTSDSFFLKGQGGLHIHTFIELLTLNPALAEKVLAAGETLLAQCPQPASLAPHAPYSVSPALLRGIAAAGARGVPLSIHNQESRAENEFFETGQGRVFDVYRFLGIAIDYFEPPGVNALRATLPHLLSQRPLLLVHNTFTSADDLVWAEALHPQLHWCFCPNANLYIENALPDFGQFLRAGVRCCIGTDSLASNHTLSVLDELKVIAANTPEIPPQVLLDWATRGGAEALGFAQLGSFEPGKQPGLVQLTGLAADYRILPETTVTRLA